MSLSPEDLPPDVRELILTLKRKRTVVLGSGPLDIAAAMDEGGVLCQKDKEALEKQLRAWKKFRERRRHDKRYADRVEDFEQWEVWRAGFHNTAARFEWFRTRCASERLDLVRVEQIRRGDERRHKLLRRKLNQIAAYLRVKDLPARSKRNRQRHG